MLDQGASIKGMYNQCEAERRTYLDRGRDSSALTIPTILPDDSTTGHKRFPTPFQSLGARAVNNLSSALLLSLLPPNAPFFRLILDEREMRKMDGIDPRIKTEVESSLSDIERSVSREIESNNIRVSTFEALRHLVVTGNALLYLPEKGPMRVIHLDRFVCKRDPMGNARVIIIKENVSPAMLPEYAQQYAEAKKSKFDDTCEIFTMQHTLPNGKVEVVQEIFGHILEETRTIYEKNRSPFIALRMLRVDGESYGRGYVEQYYGDLQSLEGLSKAIVEGSAAASKVLFLVNPNGTTRARTLAESPNGSIREGSAADVSVLKVDKTQDFSITLQAMQTISERLSYAFLLTEASIRNADRVTAEEVRLVTQSIERQLGGIYSVLSQEFQLPLVNRIIDRMQKQKKLPKIPKDKVTPTIITGIDALGRGNDLSKLDIYLQGIAQTVGPEALGQYVNIREYMSRRASALGIDTEGLVRTEEEIQGMMQQQQMMGLAQQAAPQAISTVAGQVQQDMENESV
tara:strand:+ start:4692 stop:6239 length:1548 start_codon:yes stop_codon:yes gene_type:complete